MSANILQFKVKGNVLNVYRNKKTDAISFFRKCYHEEVGIGNDTITLVPNELNEMLADVMYFIHAKNEEYEDDYITKEEHDRVCGWAMYHYDTLHSLFSFFGQHLTDKEMDNEVVGQWTKVV